MKHTTYNSPLKIVDNKNNGIITKNNKVNFQRPNINNNDNSKINNKDLSTAHRPIYKNKKRVNLLQSKNNNKINYQKINNTKINRKNTNYLINTESIELDKLNTISYYANDNNSGYLRKINVNDKKIKSNQNFMVITNCNINNIINDKNNTFYRKRNSKNIINREIKTENNNNKRNIISKRNSIEQFQKYGIKKANYDNKIKVNYINKDNYLFKNTRNNSINPISYKSPKTVEYL